jgi:hypothetical protein
MVYVRDQPASDRAFLNAPIHSDWPKRLTSLSEANTRLAVSKAPPLASLGGAVCYQTCFPFTVCRTEARTKIEFSFLNCNLLVPAARPHSFCW